MENRKIWQTPWGYQEAFFMAFSLLFVGFILEYRSTSHHSNLLTWPTNIILGLAFTCLITGVYILFRKHQIVKWLSGVPVCIASVSSSCLLIIILGVLPQQNTVEPSLINKLGLSNITSSWPFILSISFFMVSLGFASLKRIIPFKKENWGYLLNHLGLWVVLMSAFLGSGDLQRLTMSVYEGKTEWRATDKHNTILEMPIAIHLNDFSIEQYRPKIAIIDHDSVKLLPLESPQLILIEHEGIEGDLMEYKIKVLKYLPQSVFVGDKYIPVNQEGAAPAALVQYTHQPSGFKNEAWVSCGSFLRTPEVKKLDKNRSLVMTAPEAKKFSSAIKVFTRDGKNQEALLEVNKPFSIAGWKIYQMSYDERYGKWSTRSDLELIRDPWLPAVYTGVFMMIAGAIYFMFLSKTRKLIKQSSVKVDSVKQKEMELVE